MLTRVEDVVPQLPPVILGFEHSRTEIWASVLNATAAQTFQCVAQEAADCNNQAAAKGGPDAAYVHTHYPGMNTDTVCKTNS